MTWPNIRNPIYDLTIYIKILSQTCIMFRPMLNYRKYNLWRALADFLLDFDEKMTSS